MLSALLRPFIPQRALRLLRAKRKFFRPGIALRVNLALTLNSEKFYAALREMLNPVQREAKIRREWVELSCEIAI